MSYPCNDGGNIKVKNHCHVTGDYRGVAHQECNINYFRITEKLKLPSVFYMQSIAKYMNDKSIKFNFMPTNMECYIAIMFDKTVMIDLLQLMLDSLAKHFKHLPPSELKHTDKYFTDPQHRTLLRRKGVYLNYQMNYFQHLDETQLPPKKYFNSLLQDSSIGNDDNAHAQPVSSY